MKNKALAYPTLILLVAIILYLVIPSSDTKNNTIVNKPQKSSSQFDYLPTSTTNQIVKHNYYTLSYSEPHEQAEWGGL